MHSFKEVKRWKNSAVSACLPVWQQRCGRPHNCNVTAGTITTNPHHPDHTLTICSGISAQSVARFRRYTRTASAASRPASESHCVRQYAQDSPGRSSGETKGSVDGTARTWEAADVARSLIEGMVTSLSWTFASGWKRPHTQKPPQTAQASRSLVSSNLPRGRNRYSSTGLHQSGPNPTARFSTPNRRCAERHRGNTSSLAGRVGKEVPAEYRNLKTRPLEARHRAIAMHGNLAARRARTATSHPRSVTRSGGSTSM